ncbi:MAG: GNAT family N-acetyltransferase [Acidobacteriota bacterium]
MNFQIRKALPDDVSSIVGLLREFAEFEKLTDYLEITEQKLSDALFGTDAFVHCLVAYRGLAPAAYSLMYPNFASFRGQKGMYLEDIYITPDHRGSGLGAAMLAEIAKLARSQGCERIDFVVLDWNAPAIKFYEKYGAVRDDQERRFKFIDDAFVKLCS